MKSKDEIRKFIWDLLEEKKVVLFPRPPHGRIPNFIGANIASDKLDEISIWRKARIIKSNPDSPQKWIREKALKHGKTVYMAVPKLREERCFIELNPRKLFNISKAATIKGAFKQGILVYPDEIEYIDVVITGSVAVNKKGAKIGKGGGFSDLEYAIGREYGFITEETPVITTVHLLQILDEDIPMEEHDVPVDYIITKDEIIHIDPNVYSKPNGIKWDILGEKLGRFLYFRR
ncbi:MAG: 5-formyltetrahydrofolate cyclo-ligase [Thermoplasmata archaeon]|nr:MAG: 5-formyltetrahydrofolate cyclo-ligase [Thermoplasmata archaeon]HEC89975.1 5-formyltetrahydrofolate cyclo-ligase [Thermoplasmatales archaeon]